MEVKNNKKINLVVYALKFLFIVASFFITLNYVNAATLGIIPASGSYNIGEIFSVNVTVSSADQPLNAIDGIVTFPTGILEVSSLAKDNSVLNLWVEEPTYSNNTGKIAFSGVAVNPGFTGASGKVLKINFKVKKAGTAEVLFSAGSILANDGKGTNILTGFNNGQFTLSNGKVAKSIPLPVPDGKISTSLSTTEKKVSPNTDAQIVPKEPMSLFSSEFLTTAGNLLKNTFIIIFILLLLVIVLFLVFRTWHGVMLLRERLRNESKIDKQNQEQILELKNKWIEVSRQVETTKSELAYQMAALQMEKSKRAEAEEQNRKLLNENEKEKKDNADFYKQKEAIWTEELAITKAQKEEEIHRLTKIYEDETNQKANSYREREFNLKKDFEEAKLMFEKELRSAKEEALAIGKKLTETEHNAEEVKSEFLYKDSLLSSFKVKQEEAEAEKGRLIEQFKEKESSLMQELANLRMQMEIEGKNTHASYREREANLKKDIEETKLASEQELKSFSASFDEREVMLKKELKETKVALEHERSNEDEKIAEFKKKLTEAEHSLEEVRMELLHKDESLAAQKDKYKILEEENKKQIAAFREKEITLGKAQDNFEILKAKTETLQVGLASSEANVTSSQNKLAEAVKTIEDLNKELKQQTELFVSEKAELEESEEEHKKIAMVLKDKQAEFENAMNDATIKQKEMEVEMKKKLDEAKALENDAKKKMKDAEQVAEDTKTELMKTQKLLAAEQDKTKSLMTAISKLILPNTPNPPTPPAV